MKTSPILESAKKASVRTGIPYTSLRDIGFDGEIPVVKIGNRWYFERRDVDQWIESQKQRLNRP